MLARKALCKTPYLQQTGGFFGYEAGYFYISDHIKRNKKSYACMCIYFSVYIYTLAYISTQIATVESRSVPRKRTQLINAPLTMEAVLSGAPPAVHNTTAKPLLRVYSIRYSLPFSKIYQWITPPSFHFPTWPCGRTPLGLTTKNEGPCCFLVGPPTGSAFPLLHLVWGLPAEYRASYKFYLKSDGRGKKGVFPVHIH